MDDFFSSVFHVIQGLQQGKEQPAAGGQLAPQMTLLRAWQAERLKHTYRDLLENPRYQKACIFFLEDIYAARDFSRRDHDMEQLYKLASRFIPDTMLTLFRALFEINTLTNSLDQRLLDTLTSQLGLTDSLTAEMYAEAYRLCDNYAERTYQIELLAALIHDVGVGVREPLVAVALQVAHAPAKMGGWNEVYDFAQRGYRAFKKMRHPGVFSHTIQQREQRILDRIYAGDPNPFAVTGDT